MYCQYQTTLAVRAEENGHVPTGREVVGENRKWVQWCIKSLRQCRTSVKADKKTHRCVRQQQQQDTQGDRQSRRRNRSPRTLWVDSQPNSAVKARKNSSDVSTSTSTSLISAMVVMVAKRSHVIWKGEEIDLSLVKLSQRVFPIKILRQGQKDKLSSLSYSKNAVFNRLKKA